MISLKVFRILVALLLAMVILADNGHIALANSHQPKPQLNKPAKPSEVDQRTVPKPAQPESAQPPPDVVGKVPKDLTKAARKKETEKLVDPEKH